MRRKSWPNLTVYGTQLSLEGAIMGDNAAVVWNFYVTLRSNGTSSLFTLPTHSIYRHLHAPTYLTPNTMIVRLLGV